MSDNKKSTAKELAKIGFAIGAAVRIATSSPADIDTQAERVSQARTKETTQVVTESQPKVKVTSSQPK